MRRGLIGIAVLLACTIAGTVYGQAKVAENVFQDNFEGTEFELKVTKISDRDKPLNRTYGIGNIKDEHMAEVLIKVTVTRGQGFSPRICLHEWSVLGRLCNDHGKGRRSKKEPGLGEYVIALPVAPYSATVEVALEATSAGRDEMRRGNYPRATVELLLPAEQEKKKETQENTQRKGGDDTPRS